MYSTMVMICTHHAYHLDTLIPDRDGSIWLCTWVLCSCRHLTHLLWLFLVYMAGSYNVKQAQTSQHCPILWLYHSTFACLFIAHMLVGKLELEMLRYGFVSWMDGQCMLSNIDYKGARWFGKYKNMGWISFLTCFLGEWMSLYIPRASENGITSVHPEEVPSFWWGDNQHIHSPNSWRIGILA
jgi:hypothetical protein